MGLFDDNYSLSGQKTWDLRYLEETRPKLNFQTDLSFLNDFSGSPATLMMNLKLKNLQNQNDFQNTMKQYQASNLNTSINGKLSDTWNNSFMGKNASMIGSGLDTVGNVISGFTKNQYEGPKGDLRSSIDLGWNSISDAAALMGPYGLMASVAMKAAGALNSLQGAIFGATDNMTTTDSIMDSPLGFLTGVGWINQAFGKKSNTITKDDEAFELVGSSYGGTGNVVDDALTKSGKKYGAFSGAARNKANEKIAEATRLQSIMSDISNTANTRNAIKSSMTAINSNARQFAMNGGYNQAAIHVGKQGMRIQRVKNIDFKKPTTEEFVEDEIEEIELKGVIEFQKGGSFNIIPEGALHARKHNIQLDGITKKGIPVISEEEGLIQQQAEIEHSEIIFRLEVTKKLEELAKINEDSNKTQKEKDESAIEAGKLLVDEILYNTNDKIGLLNA